MQRNWIGKSEGTEISFEVEEKRKPTILLVHGWCGNGDENWFKWFKEEYKDKFNIIAPNFPDTNNPKLGEWLLEMEKYRDLLDEDSILIGHSLGCPVICKFLEESKAKVGKVILVAPSSSYYNENDFNLVRNCGAPKKSVDILGEFHKELKIDFDRVKEFADKFVMYLSANDPYVYDFDYRVKEYSGLGFELRRFEDKGHFNEDAKVLELPEIDSDVGNDSKKKPTILLVHGLGKDSNESWLRWFKKNYEKDYNVIAPNFPNSSEPKLSEWLLEMEKYKDALDEDSILIGQSLGCPTICKFLEKNKIKVKRVILVAAGPPRYNEDDFKIIDNLIPKKSFEAAKKYTDDLDLDFSKVKEFANDFVVFFSKDDPYAFDFEYRLKEYSELNPEVVLFENKSHFNDSAGILELPEIDKYIRNIWKVFTTRPDTIFGVTFMVVAAQHERLDELVTDEQKDEVDKFLKGLGSTSEKEMATLEKEGVFSGSYAVNPANGKRVPIWIGNFVVADYGSGMVMGVPAHDARDYEFAKKYGIEVRQVVAPFIRKNVDGDKETKERCTVFGIVKNLKTGKILCLDWKKTNWKAFPAGGVDDGEDVVEAVKREIKEETGYKNLNFVRKIGGELYQNFYRPHKGNNVYCKNEAYYFELADEKMDKVDEAELEKHEAVWIDEDKVKDFINVFGTKIVWDWYLNGDAAYVGEGVLCNSGEFDRMDNVEAKEKITDWLIEKKVGKRVVNYKLRDWGFSRQRYWGTPIPIINCEKCGAVPVSEDDLPVELPDEVSFGKGNALETNEKWLSAKCPKCGGKGRREAETMDTFFDSSWYFLRYPDNKNDEVPFDKGKIAKWLPVDQYIGGAEHACMHLIYARFFTKALRDLGFLDFDEPFMKLFNQGMLHGPDGDKMSKSKGNVINPDEVSKKYGMDAARFFLLSLAAPDKERDWSEKGIMGSVRFIKKIMDFYDKSVVSKDCESKEFVSKLNESVRDVTEYYDNFQYRKATIRLKELFDLLVVQEGVSRESLEISLKLLSPICPHIAEELWESLCKASISEGRCSKADEGKGLVSVASWPEFDEGKILKKSDVGDLNGKIVDRIKEIIKTRTGAARGIPSKLGTSEEVPSSSGKVYVYVMPFEIGEVDGGKISEGIGKNVEVFAVNDSGKVDPKGMAKKAKPGMAAIYLE